MSWWTSTPVVFFDDNRRLHSSSRTNFNIISSVATSDLGVWFPGDPGPGEYANQAIGVVPAFVVR